jgi:hypothetical protein
MPGTTDTTTATSFTSIPAAVIMPPVAAERGVTGAVAASASFSTSAALLDHYSHVIHSKALARSVLELKHRVEVFSALSGRRPNTWSSSTAKARPFQTKFSIFGHRSPMATATLSRGMRKKSHLASPVGFQPLRAPPALPRVTPGQQLIGMKVSSEGRIFKKK